MLSKKLGSNGDLGARITRLGSHVTVGLSANRVGRVQRSLIHFSDPV
jgi:hypothetical protein